MAVLSLERTLFPERLFEDLANGEATSGVWWVAHTKPRTEKALARQLVNRSVPFFLPLYTRRSRHRNQIVVCYPPLFPSYVFLHSDEESRIEALKTNLIVRTIQVIDQEKLHAELTAVHRLIEAGVSLAPEDRLQPGMRVEISSGPLKGLEGKVIRRGNQQRFLVEVDFLSRGVSAEVEGWAIRSI